VQPQFAAVLGEVPFCEEAAVAAGGNKNAAVAAAKRAMHAGGAAKPAKEEKKKEEKKKEEPKPKAEKAKKEKEVDADAPPMDLPKEEKKVDPLAALPKSSLNLDEWKRHYSNTKPHIGAMPWFWEHLDKEGWSLWKQDYNYNAGEFSSLHTTTVVLARIFLCCFPLKTIH
jgi:elongation factor 1-gamma